MMLDHNTAEQLAEQALDKVMQKYSNGKLNWQATKYLMRQFNSKLKSEEQFNAELTQIMAELVKTAILLVSLSYESRLKNLSSLEEELARERKRLSQREESLASKDREIKALLEHSSLERQKFREAETIIKQIHEDGWLDWLIRMHEDDPSAFQGAEIEKIKELEKKLEGDKHEIL